MVRNFLYNYLTNTKRITSFLKRRMVSKKKSEKNYKWITINYIWPDRIFNFSNCYRIKYTFIWKITKIRINELGCNDYLVCQEISNAGKRSGLTFQVWYLIHGSNNLYFLRRFCHHRHHSSSSVKSLALYWLWRFDNHGYLLWHFLSDTRQVSHVNHVRHQILALSISTSVSRQLLPE